ncbi:maleylpyruvate isomerase family mycothiol-dependent enzyme [Rhizobium sp. WYJ-E13]|uniref:maleylpyruvate isomerase family mycothiol-dependent enzyme n=1 Tax=Rhizobium sp. WYJ-E13 TaxID=2849093 RepID=UPI001C1EBB19|nr:maleylpyruvate isomerase family mycothiol-dependent enzyme [Rhizobium sp. WYJ-E13]QWW72602.1 maleylpyruvate isomerase family mycothiol-dependent enzyme [Rhizobium sp. WYJ-E13]
MDYYNATVQALRERQGKGARYDSPAAPAEELAMARLGTAYFARVLNAIPDEDLDQSSLISGWSRRHVVAYVAYQARALALSVDSVHDGAAPVSFDDRAMIDLVEQGSTLPARALRNLVNHAEVHLNVGWRDLSAPAWDNVIRWEGASTGLRQTPWIRARAVWIHAVDLASQGSFLDFPPPLLTAMIEDLQETAGIGQLSISRHSPSTWTVTGNEKRLLASGAPADILRWLSGRGARRLQQAAPQLPAFDPRRWPSLPGSNRQAPL